MQAVVKMPHIEPFTIKGETIPDNVLDYMKSQGNVTILDDEYILVTETDWYKNIKEEMTPAVVLKTYRKMKGFTLAELGKRLGGLSRQNVSDLEKGRRTITVDMAHKLAEVFETNYKRFL